MGVSLLGTLLRVAEFRGVQAQILMGSLRDIVIGGVTLRPGRGRCVTSEGGFRCSGSIQRAFFPQREIVTNGVPLRLFKNLQ